MLRNRGVEFVFQPLYNTSCEFCFRLMKANLRHHDEAQTASQNCNFKIWCYFELFSRRVKQEPKNASVPRRPLDMCRISTVKR